MTNATPNFAKDQTAAWGRSLGNGATALALGVDAIEHVRTHGDTTVLIRMAERAKERNDNNAASALMFMVKQVWPGAKLAKSKAGPTLKIKGIAPVNSAVDTLATLKAEGASLRGSKLREAFRGDADKPEFDPKVVTARVCKPLTKAQAQQVIAAMQAHVKTMK